MTAPIYWFDDYHTHASAGVFLLTDDERLILQLRDQRPDIENPGCITPFAGGAESGETPVACALRELAEETGLEARAEELHLLGTTSKLNAHGHRLASVYFLLRGVNPERLAITEGTMISLSFAEFSADPRVTEDSRTMGARISTAQSCHFPE